MAQVPPVLILDDASVFEGNAGTKVLQLPLRFVGAQPNTVTGTVSATPLTGSGFNAATGGAACGGAVDFVSFTNVPFSIPPNTPNGTLYIGITICGNTTIEPNEHIFVSMTASGAQCLEGTCNGVGTILNDDGPPTLSIDNTSTSEPVTGSKTTTFTVSLSHPSTLPISVNFTTRNGTATAACAPPCFALPDYNAKSGTLSIPASTAATTVLSGTIGITILGDNRRESDETFFVDLSSPVNATIADGTGQATIRDTTLSTGGFDLSPDNASVEVDELLVYTIVWTVPDNEVWRDLESIDLRIRNGHSRTFWVRWDEHTNEFSLCRKGGKNNAEDGDQTRAGKGHGAGVVCGPGALPGSSTVLETAFARLHLAESSVVGSGPTGQSVTLEFALSFTKKAAGHSYVVELAAADDFGNADRFVRAAELRVEKAGKHH